MDADVDTEKRERYLKLVEERKECTLCSPKLANPAGQKYSLYDTREIGLWSRWQNSLDADVLVVGQDWGGTLVYEQDLGNEDDTNPTNRNLVRLLGSIGINIQGPEKTDVTDQRLFFTNVILCLKEGYLTEAVSIHHAKCCCSKFLRPLIEIIEPKAVITLGTYAYRSVASSYGIPVMKFIDAVSLKEGFVLQKKTRLFPVFHCGTYGWNINRKNTHQFEDWKKIGAYLHCTSENQLLQSAG